MAAPHLQQLAGRAVLITGGSSGIGLTAARIFTSHGARVALVARDERLLREAAAIAGGETLALPADVTDRPALDAAMREADRRLGGLDVVVANAGLAAFGAFREMAPEDFDRTVDVTFRGMANTIRTGLELLEPRRGSLVVTGSVAGRIPVPLMAPYVASKHALRGLVRTLQAEQRATGSAVSISLVAPGPVATPFWLHVKRVAGIRPPQPRGNYSADTVARAIAECAVRPRRELTVGGAMNAVQALDAVATPALEAVMALGARRILDRERGPEEPGILWQPADTVDQAGGLRGRPSLSVALRGALGRRAWLRS